MNIASTTKSMVAILAVCLISQPIFAQNVFWSEDFGGGMIPSTWSNYDSIDPTIIWEYETDAGRVTTDPAFGGVAFQSTTVGNGFAIFDSDGYGENVTHDVRLETSAIDCSTQPNVFIRFENQYAPFNPSSVAELGVSSDSVNWTYYTLFPGLSGNTTPQIANQTEEIDISAVAGNQATVYLQFRWQGSWEYSWKIDDIGLQDAATPLPSDNLALGDFFFVPNNFGTPASQIPSDTFDFFGVDVSNLGSSDQTNVIVTAEIVDGATLSIVHYFDTIQMGTIPAGDPDSIFFASFDRFFVPDQLPTIGEYALIYSISSDGTDIDPSDNVTGARFEITDSTFRKDVGSTTAVIPGGGGDFLIGNVYTTDNNFVAGDFIASTAEISVASNTTIGGESVTVWLAEVSDNVNNTYSNFDVISDLNNNSDLTVVGFASYQFPTAAGNFDVFTINLEDLQNGGLGIPLKPGTRYFLLTEVSDASGLFYAIGEQINMFQVSTILYTTGWFLGGFGPEETALARLNISTPVSTNQVELKNATLDVFPNPAQNYATVDLKLETATDAVLTVSDVTGRIVYHENLNNASNEHLTLDVSQYAAGTYFVKVTTTEGIKTQRLVVTH